MRPGSGGRDGAARVSGGPAPWQRVYSGLRPVGERSKVADGLDHRPAGGVHRDLTRHGGGDDRHRGDDCQVAPRNRKRAGRWVEHAGQDLDQEMRQNPAAQTAPRINPLAVTSAASTRTKAATCPLRVPRARRTVRLTSTRTVASCSTRPRHSGLGLANRAADTPERARFAQAWSSRRGIRGSRRADLWHPRARQAASVQERHRDLRADIRRLADRSGWLSFRPFRTASLKDAGWHPKGSAIRSVVQGLRSVAEHAANGFAVDLGHHRLGYPERVADRRIRHAGVHQLGDGLSPDFGDLDRGLAELLECCAGLSGSPDRIVESAKLGVGLVQGCRQSF